MKKSETEDKSTLLEEVFNELDSSENILPKKTTIGESLLFLDSIFDSDKKLSTKNKNPIKQNKVQESSFQILEKEKSYIHEGLTDSSDDEDNKYFEEAKYNECGKSLKDLLKQKPVLKNSIANKISRIKDTWVNDEEAKKKVTLQLDKIKNKKENVTDILVDPILGMRIINPLFSSSTLREKMIGRTSIGTSNLKKFVESTASKECDWVTGGVIISKLTRTSQKGNPYCIWNVTDLNGDIKTTSIFLFGSAYKEYWKTSVGTVIGVLNPFVMESKSNLQATLRVDTAEKILIMGISKDYGICKSKKINGENCTSIVNVAKCDFCIYHMKKEYNKACRRSDLQPPKIGRNLDSLRSKVLGKNTVFYGGKAFTANVGKKSSKQLEKDKQTLLSLDRQIPTALSEFQLNKEKNILNKLSTTESKNETTSIPAFKGEMDLNFTVSKKDRITARLNALKYIKEHGPLKKPEDDRKKNKTPEQILCLKRKLEICDTQENKKKKFEENVEKKNTFKEKLEKHGITDEFIKLMNSNCHNSDLLTMAENEEKEKYFNKLETKEKIEDKMASTFKLECKAVRCLKCNYKAFSASELCKKEKHPLKVVNAIKRFWKCGDCSARTVCLELIPLHSCKSCGSSKWERASMMPEKKGSNLTVEPLSLRGHEEKFIGASVKNANLNLLVPDEIV